MNRSKYSFVSVFAVAAVTVGVHACAPASDGSRDGDVAAGDSSLVVASGSRVPSGDATPDTGPRVVFLGTSLTAGFGLDDPDDGWVARLDALADSSGSPIRAVNAGVSGETSAGGLRRLDWALREPVDILVVELGANDGLRGLSPDAMAGNLAEIARSAQTRYPNVEVVIVGMEAPPNLGDAYTAAFRAVFPAVAEDVDATLVPFLLDGVAGVDSLNQNDRIHPTAEGHARIASNVWPVLEPVVRRAAARSGS